MERPATNGRRRVSAAPAQAFCKAKLAVSDKDFPACELRANGYQEWRG